MTLSALCVVDKFTKQQPVVYVAVADGQSFEVYAGLIKENNEIKQMENILSVTEAQNDTIQGVQMFFD